MASKNQASTPAPMTDVPQTTTDAPSATPAAAQPSLPFAVIPKKQLTQNVLKMRSGSLVYVRVTGAHYEAKALKNERPSEKDKKRPELLPVTNLVTGQTHVLICGSVLLDVFTDEYPGGEYVGKCFRISLEEKKEAKEGGGRTYNTYNVTEIEDPGLFLNK